MKTLLASLFGMCVYTGAACAQVVQDGNMDALTPGSAPDYATPAGAWGFPAFYQTNLVAEPTTLPELFTVVPTNSFQPGALGNSMHLINLAGTTADNYHLPNIWSQSFTAAPGLILRVTLRLWVTSGTSGGAFYVGGDNGGGGFSNATGDRTAQLSWTADGQLNATNNAAVNVPLHSYGFDAWQNIEIDIDTGNRNYNLFWSMGSDPLIQIGANLMFRAPDPTLSVIYDRITYVQFGATVPVINSYLDNVVVTAILPCGSADFNCDGDVGTDQDISAFFACLSGTCPAAPCRNSADFNGDGDVGTDQDIAAFFRVLAGGSC